MNSTWQTEIAAVFRKEWRGEIRSKSGLMTVGLFAFVTVVAISIATYNLKISGSLAAGLIWVAMLFSASIALPRTFVVEEELGTGDLLRLAGNPESIFWGKALFNLAIMLITGLGVSLLFLLFTGMAVTNVPLFLVCLLGSGFALSGAVTLCGALVAQASNRSALAGAISLPLLMPLVFMGVSGLRVALGQGLTNPGWISGVGMIAYGVLTLVTGPQLYRAIWKK